MGKQTLHKLAPHACLRSATFYCGIYSKVTILPMRSQVDTAQPAQVDSPVFVLGVYFSIDGSGFFFKLPVQGVPESCVQMKLL